MEFTRIAVLARPEQVHPIDILRECLCVLGLPLPHPVVSNGSDEAGNTTVTAAITSESLLEPALLTVVHNDGAALRRARGDRRPAGSVVEMRLASESSDIAEMMHIWLIIEMKHFFDERGIVLVYEISESGVWHQ